ncbi:MAG: DUF3108 domain-containing protein [Gemmatimonadaceae bacterium]
MRPGIPPSAALQRALVGGLAILALGGARGLTAQPAPVASTTMTTMTPMTSMTSVAAEALPHIMPGERFSYLVRSSRFGTIGKGTMGVEGPTDVRGTPAYLLRFAFSTRVGPVRVVNETESWVDAADGALLRFHKHERHPLSSQDEAVELFPAERRWENASGASGTLLTALPLDELSYIYFIRSLPLTPGAVYEVERHFDAARNPSVVRVVSRDTVTTSAGVFPTIVVELEVRDARRYKGKGTLRFFLTDDSCRVPVLMVSTMPVVGTMTLELQSHTNGSAAVALGRP